MNNIENGLIDNLFSLASSRLKLYKGMLSCIRLYAINLSKKKIAGSNSVSLTNKQQEFIKQIDKINDAYHNALCDIENEELKSALSLGTPDLSNKYPELSRLFSILQEEREVIKKASSLNKQSIEKVSLLSFEYRKRIQDVQQRKKFKMKYNTSHALKAGSLFNFKEDIG